MKTSLTVDDIRIAELRKCIHKGDNPLLLAQSFAMDYKALARKAAWAYSHYRKRAGCIEYDRKDFINSHLDAWAEFLVSAASVDCSGLNGQPILVDESPSLYVLWHFPNYPIFSAQVVICGGLVLVARVAPWMKPLSEAGLLFPFRNRSAIGLLRACKQGRPLFAMMDYCYDETSSMDIPFLGYPARTPIGILKLAQRFCYRIRIVCEKDKQPFFREIGPISELSLQDLATNINAEIQAEILRDPPSWLLWASVDRRWRNVDYSK